MHERKDGLRSDFLESKKKEMKSGNMEEIAQGVGLATSFDPSFVVSPRQMKYIECSNTFLVI